MQTLPSGKKRETGPAEFPKRIPARYRWSWDHFRGITRPAIAFEFWFTVLY